ncbi:MAG: hypothetical protein QXG40_01865 [Ignisphaera sp.]
MRFYEGCWIVDPFKNFTSIAEYVSRLFDISHTVAVFIAVEPAVIATRVEGVLRRIAIAPGYAILCNSRVFYNLTTVYMLAETAWIESDVLIPYSSTKPCSNKLRRYRISLEIDENLGIPHLCTKDINSEPLRRLSTMGGLLELLDDMYSGVGTLRIFPIKDKFFLIVKGLGVGTVHDNVKYSIVQIDVYQRLGVFTMKLAAVDSATAIASIGKSYLILFESLVPVEDSIYPLLLIAAHTIPSNEPRAKYYVSRLGSI